MAPDAGLRAAFLGAHYGLGGERVTLQGTQPGHRPPWAPPGGRWAMITAYNPGAQPQSRAENVSAQARLRQQAARWAPLETVNGSGPHAEPSLLLRGVPLREAAALGRASGQVAIVWGVGRRAALVWLQGEGARPERHWLSPVP
ncbi:DUF3293 domain-containing protein [Deinococcus arcticus]|uniref:DUF3293 domain-containing protein n=1 Tax=Deinococcus arcticus TaxID=2136176 RepID=A0A2T3WCQ0_9DEIO|nr:DUF3293 domain-containing protein [Deinococcus arcticus]PTA69513.1 DUF3293 domain-containing protein [Deinococcus arcticus]